MNQRKRILIVDDDEQNRKLLRGMLKSLGYDSEMVSDGAKALVKVRDGFDLVLMDVMMPGMDGFEATARIREIPECEDVPIIMVTILTGNEDRLRAVEAGANDFISKPIDILELKVRAASLLKMKAAQDAVKLHTAELEFKVEQRTKALKESEERFRRIFEMTEDCILIKDANLRYTQVNPAVERTFEIPASKLVGLTDEEVFGPEEARKTGEIDERVLAGEFVEAERTRLLNGTPVTFHEIRMPMTDSAGKIMGLCCIARNITDRKRAATPPIARERACPSNVMHETQGFIEAAIRSDGIVLITGESGCGKDYLSRYIHDHSRRASGPFFGVNCAAVAPELAESELFGHEAGAFTGAARRKKGLLELAEGGTLLLNEIGELSPHLQAKLLTFLDTRTFTRVGG
jgi:PAS domain S-box-containing protein